MLVIHNVFVLRGGDGRVTDGRQHRQVAACAISVTGTAHVLPNVLRTLQCVGY